MSDKPLFGDDSTKGSSSEKGLFDKPAKKQENSIFTKESSATSTKKSEAKSSDDIFAKSAKSPASKPTPTTDTPAEQPSVAIAKKPKKPADPKKRKKILGIVIACLGAIVLLAGGVSAAIWFIWYNSDEGVLSSAIDELVDAKDIDLIIDGSVKAGIEDENVDIQFVLDMLTRGKAAQFGFSLDATVPESRWVSGKTQYTCDDRKYSTSAEARADCGWDYDYDYQPGHYEYDTASYELSAEAIAIDSDLFVKADFSQLADILSISDLSDLEDFNSQWIRISEDYLTEMMGDSAVDIDATQIQTCTEDIVSRYPHFGKEVYTLATKEDGGYLTITPRSTKDNLTTYAVTFSTDLEDYAAFFEAVYDHPAVTGIMDCYIEAMEAAMENSSGDLGIASSAINRQTIDKIVKQMIKQLRRADKEDFAESIEDYMPEIILTINRSTRHLENIAITADIEGSELTVDLDFKVNTRSDTKEIAPPQKYKNIKDLTK